MSLQVLLALVFFLFPSPASRPSVKIRNSASQRLCGQLLFGCSLFDRKHPTPNSVPLQGAVLIDRTEPRAVPLGYLGLHRWCEDKTPDSEATRPGLHLCKSCPNLWTIRSPSETKTPPGRPGGVIGDQVSASSQGYRAIDCARRKNRAPDWGVTRCPETAPTTGVQPPAADPRLELDSRV